MMGNPLNPAHDDRGWQGADHNDVEMNTLLANNPLDIPRGISRGSSTSSNRLMAEPRLQLPKFSGKGDWKSFYVQFEFLAAQYNWDEMTQVGYLIGCIEGSAMEFVARLPPKTRYNFIELVDALNTCYGDPELPETYRATLQSLKKQPKEGLHEYAARVADVVSKAYPGLEGTKLYTDLIIEHIICGLPDQNLIYDVLSKQHTTVEGALRMISWHECCKSMKGHRPAICKVENNGEWGQTKSTKNDDYITEGKLLQFGKELQDNLVKIINEKFTMQKQFSVPKFEGQQFDGNKGAREQKQAAPVNCRPEVAVNNACYTCGEFGDYARSCTRNRYPGGRRSQDTGNHRISH